MGKTYKIGVLPGDGVGPEIIREGMKVVDAVSKKTGFIWKNGYERPRRHNRSE